MKKTITVALTIALGVGLAAPVSAKTTRAYRNTKCGYALEVPVAMVPGDWNGECVATFVDPHGTAELNVWPTDVGTAAGQCESYRSDNIAVTTFRVTRQRFCVVSGVTDQKISYFRADATTNGSLAYEMTYPMAEKAKWSPAVTKTAGTLHTI